MFTKIFLEKELFLNKKREFLNANKYINFLFNSDERTKGKD